MQTHVQASGRKLTTLNLGRILYQEEGLTRFWKGIHVMASGCVPAHTSYFLAYEKLKIYWGYQNDEFNFGTTLCIGASTTFVHDFFIAPSDVVKQRL